MTSSAATAPINKDAGDCTAALVLDAKMLLSTEATRGVLPEILDAENIAR